MEQQTTNSEPTRAEVDQLPGLVLLEFGASWCGHCLALRPHLPGLLQQCPGIRHIMIEDGRGRPLGRSFQVKLWPTFVLLREGQVLARLVRPVVDDLQAQLAAAFAGAH